LLLPAHLKQDSFFFFLYSDKYKTEAVDTYICCQLISVHVYAEFSYSLLAGEALLDSPLILGLNIVFSSLSTPETKHILCSDKLQTVSC
jgi:hypothetical protein